MSLTHIRFYRKRQFSIHSLFHKMYCFQKAGVVKIPCTDMRAELLLKFGKSSFLRKQESSSFKTFWIPAYAGMTKWGYFSKLSIWHYRKTGYFLQGVKMKRFLLPLFLSFLFSISFALASFAEGNRTITILYTGAVKGTLDPCYI